MSDEVQRFLSSLPRWSKFFDVFRLPPAVREEQAIGELQQRLGNIRRRLRDGPHAPLRIAFFGPTGAGKSKLFGSLIRDNFSGSGFKRPFTRRSFYYVHRDWKPLVAALPGEVALHDESDWQDIILIDTPDFDSVELENRMEAERVFLESDGFLFVTDALKYADASTWEYLKRIHASGRSFAIVLNKVNSETVPESFRQRYERTLTQGQKADYAQVVVPEFRIDDAKLIDPDQPSMKALQDVAHSLLRGERSRQQTSASLLEKDCEAFCSDSDELRIRITGKRTQISEARMALQRRAEAAKHQLETRLASGLEPSVRESVYQDVLRRLEKIDVLSYPRKLIAMPIQGMRSLVSQWLPRKPTPPPEDPAFADPISSETFYLLESEVIGFADQSRNDIVARPGLEDLIDRDTFRELRFSHEELQQKYAEHHQRFRNWVASHAEATASQITGENKAKFVLSQVLFNTVLISSQAAVGGAFSLLDLGTAGVISPMVAKGISMAIGSEKVKEFEAAAHAEHQRSLAELLDQSRERFDQFLEKSCLGLDELEQNLNEISAWRSSIDEIVTYFQESGGGSAPGPLRSESTPEEGSL